MAHDRDALRAHADALNALSRALHTAVRMRDRSPEHRQRWIDAATEFRRGCTSPIGLRLEACATGPLDRPDDRRLAFDFVACDPYYFRSGYLMERLLKRIRVLVLTETERQTLRALVLRRIDNGGQRNFRHVCRSIPQLLTPGFLAELQARTSAADPAVASRARLALSYAGRSAS